MLERALSQDLHVRTDGRTVFGIAVPFNSPTVVNDGFGPYTEVFNRGSFAKTIQENADRVKLLVNHDRTGRLPIGRATLLREDSAGLYMEARVSKTAGGDEVLELIRDGALDGFSVGFQPVKDREVDTRTVERLEVKLNEVSTVAFPAYHDALIAGVRAQHPTATADEVEAALELIRQYSPTEIAYLVRTRRLIGDQRALVHVAEMTARAGVATESFASSNSPVTIKVTGGGLTHELLDEMRAAIDRPDNHAPDEEPDPDTSGADEEPEAVEPDPVSDEPPDDEAAPEGTSGTPRHSNLPEPPAHSGPTTTAHQRRLVIAAVEARLAAAHRQSQEREHDVRALERAGRN